MGRGAVRAGSRSPEDPELNLHGAFLHLRLKPPHEHLADQGAGGRKKSEKAKRVRQHAGSDEEGASDQNDDPVHEFFPRKVSLR